MPLSLLQIDRQSVGETFGSLPLVVEAGVRSGNREAAERALNELEVMHATASATPWALGLLKRSQALMADDSLAEEMFQQSIAYLQQTLVLIDLTLAQLSYGEWLRRHQRPASMLVPNSARHTRHSSQWELRDLLSVHEASFSPPVNTQFAGV